jgi:hypothetical protein
VDKDMSITNEKYFIIEVYGSKEKNTYDNIAVTGDSKIWNINGGG